MSAATTTLPSHPLSSAAMCVPAGGKSGDGDKAGAVGVVGEILEELQEAVEGVLEDT